MVSNHKLLILAAANEQTACSIGSFSRNEYAHLRGLVNVSATLVLPGDSSKDYDWDKIESIIINEKIDFIILHSPSIFDRSFPWRFLSLLLILRKLVRSRTTKIILVNHEFSESPWTWKVRALLQPIFSDLVIVNTKNDYQSMARFWGDRIRYLPLAPAIAGPRLESEEIGALQQAKPQYSILVPGLVTKGKGLEFLLSALVDIKKSWGTLGRIMPRVVLMGGMGPKDLDRQYAEALMRRYAAVLGSSFQWMQNLSDTDFQSQLIEAGLIALPFDYGVSQRRSSFLSAMSCGANVWTTQGSLSGVMHLEQSGVWVDNVGSVQQLNNALNHLWCLKNQSDAHAFVEWRQRRKLNQEWANAYSWDARMNGLQKIFSFFRA